MKKSCDITKPSRFPRLKHLVVYCHPDGRSLSSAYKEEVVRLTEQSCNEVIVRDLYNIGFQPVLCEKDILLLKQGKIPEDIKVEQDYIAWANLITFIYPVWWTGLPAMLKGYIDRVFSTGFAYAVDDKRQIKRLLTGKNVIIINNMGEAYEAYEKSGMLNSLRQTCDEGIFAFCGMNVLEHRFFGRLAEASEKEREAHIHLLGLIYNKILPQNG